MQTHPRDDPRPPRHARPQDGQRASRHARAAEQPSPLAPLTGMIACAMALAACGVVAGVSSAPPGQGWDVLSLHVGHLVIALTAFLASYSLPSQDLRRAAPGLLVVLFLVLVAMLFPGVGHSSHNAERWILLPGGFTLQPSVLLQCLWPVALVSWAARDPLRLTQPLQVARLMGGFILLMLPVMFQPDLGSVMVLIVVTGITLFFAGVSMRFLRVIVPLAVVALFSASMLFKHVSDRFTLYFSGEHGHQVGRALEAFAAGGVSGSGPGQGQLKFGWVPEGETDFILALVAEEFGLAGSLVLVLLFGALTVCGVAAARRAERRYGALLTAAATVVISLQAAINIAVVTGIAPPKGLPLPFVSRGGTSVMALAALLGLAARACLERRSSKVPVEDLIPWTESNAAA